MSGFTNFELGNLIMIVVGCVFIYLAIKKDYEPLLLVPIGFGILIGNVPIPEGLRIGIYEDGSVLRYLYFGVLYGVYPPLIFMGIGAMTDFSCLISKPKLILLGAAAQIGIFATFIAAIWVGATFPGTGLMDDPAGLLGAHERLRRAAASIGIIGGADGPTAIFLSSQLAPDLLGAIAISAYSYMALVPVIQPPIMKLLTTREERLIRMAPPPPATKIQKILFPIVGLLVCTFIAPGALPLLGMLFFGNLLKESGVTERLARTARNPFIDIVTILLGVTVGASTQASTFLKPQSIVIFIMGALSFMVATAAGVLFAKLMNLVSKEKINPLIGAAGVSAVPDSARVVHTIGQEEDPNNFLIMHAMGPNVAGVIGSAVGAGVLLAIFR
ncbi:MAG: sodium ion-translocating decarboxylase subunit beta [Gemmatimonadetes bacterium]|nr:MAG: sodium ion-translocating decarboxylase subunit beta [Gemmatimonadota bacterium]